MSYFDQDDHNAVVSTGSLDMLNETALQRVHNRMKDIHRAIYPRLKKVGIELHPVVENDGGISQVTACSPFPADVMALTYIRPRIEALLVERMMGRDDIHINGQIEAYRHPVIEFRLSPDFVTLELIVAPTAWYDQQNLIGKLSINQHRLQFYQLLARIGGGYFLGFWGGVHLNNMHMETDHLPPRRILFEYVDTFAARRDWLRLGRWYEPGDASLSDDHIIEEMFQQIRVLYPLYKFLAWNSNNNFQSFYHKRLTRS